MKKFAALLAGLMMMAAGSAWAVPTLTLTDGVNFVNVQDTDADGAVYFNGVVGLWNINVSTGLTNPAIGSTLVPDMDLNSVNHSTGASSIKIFWSSDNFTGIVPGFKMTIGGTSAGNVSYSAYYDPTNAISTNTISATAQKIGQLDFTNTPFSGGLEQTLLTSGTYSLTQLIEITHTVAGTTSFDATLAPVPEPGTIFLLGAGLLGLGIYGRRRAKK